MKSKNYRSGKTTFRTYLKDVGNGWEVGFVCGPKTYFVGNFIKSTEANQWFSLMNAEIRKFSKRFTVGSNCPKTWYFHFLGSNLYKHYYSFVNKALVHHNRKYTTTVNRETRVYRKLSRNWVPSERRAFLKAA